MSTSGPAERVVELAIYAPVGLAVRASEELPALIATGRARAAARVDVARMVGRMAVEQGRQMVRRRLESALAGRMPAPFSTPSHAVDVAPPAEPPAGDATAAVAAPLAVDLAIDHYDSLAAAQVVDLLPSLTPAELDDVERYERAHRKRRTVLGKISQLRA